MWATRPLAGPVGTRPTPAPRSWPRARRWVPRRTRRDSGSRPSGRYRDELTTEYAEKPDSGYSGGRRAGGYADEPGAGYSGSRRATHRAAYEDEPTGVYRESDPLYSGSGPDHGYEQEPTGPYPEDSLAGAYSDSSLPRRARHTTMTVSPAGMTASPAGTSQSRPRRTRATVPDGMSPSAPPRTPLAGTRTNRPACTAATCCTRATRTNRAAATPAGRLNRGSLHHGLPNRPGRADAGRLSRRQRPARPPRHGPGWGLLARAALRQAPVQRGGRPPQTRGDEPRRSRGPGDDDDPGPGSFPYGAPPSERPARGRAR